MVILCLKFQNEKYIKIKREVDGKTNFYSYFINCNFKKFQTLDEENPSGMLEILIYI